MSTTKSSVKTNKMVVCKKLNCNAVQVNCYDADGNLKWTDSDKQSWEESDIQHYEWSDNEEKPIEVDVIEGCHKKCIFDGDQSKKEFLSDGRVLVLTKTEVCSTPCVTWTGTDVESSSDPNRDLKRTTKTEGSKQVHCEESVWMTTSKQDDDLPSIGQTRAIEIFPCSVEEQNTKSNGTSTLLIPKQSDRRKNRRNVNREMISVRNQVLDR